MSVDNLAPRADFGAMLRSMPFGVPRAWQRLSLRAKLIVVFVVVDLIAALVVGAVTILKARTSTRVEITASMSLAKAFVADTIRLAQGPAPMTAIAEQVSAQQKLLRHVRLSVRDAGDVPVTAEPPQDTDVGRSLNRAPAPAWFAALIAPPVERQELPVILGGQRVGSVVIAGEPADETAEAWENFAAQNTVGILLNSVMIALLYVLFGRVLGPLARFSQGLRHLESRKYEVRLGRPDDRELGEIADRFNALAHALDTLRAENADLTRRLITAQDDERRHTALELHDEVGPCLFGLKANAGSIAAHPNAPDLVARARDMLAIIDRLQGINRSLLNRLRPMALGHVPLGELLSEVVRERARQHAELRVTVQPQTLRPSYGDVTDLTIYRCVQEGLTNAIRHARATRIDIAFRETHDALTLRIEDDGRGIDPAAAPGHGLRGMQERVQALSGVCSVENTGGGTRIDIAIPIAGKPADSRQPASAPVS
jgi:two-component system, NarL family, sensor histidine kinase UhpB